MVNDVCDFMCAMRNAAILMYCISVLSYIFIIILKHLNISIILLMIKHYYLFLLKTEREMIHYIILLTEIDVFSALFYFSE